MSGLIKSEVSGLARLMCARAISLARFDLSVGAIRPHPIAGEVDFHKYSLRECVSYNGLAWACPEINPTHKENRFSSPILNTVMLCSVAPYSFCSFLFLAPYLLAYFLFNEFYYHLLLFSRNAIRWQSLLLCELLAQQCAQCRIRSMLDTFRQLLPSSSLIWPLPLASPSFEPLDIFFQPQNDV